jgi:hypothetical protein
MEIDSVCHSGASRLFSILEVHNACERLWSHESPSGSECIPFESAMSFTHAHDLAIRNSSFIDVRGDLNSFSVGVHSIERAESGA